MHNLKFLLDADMPKSSAEVIQNLGFEIKDLIGAIMIVELSRYRRRSLSVE